MMQMKWLKNLPTGRKIPKLQKACFLKVKTSNILEWSSWLFQYILEERKWEKREIKTKDTNDPVLLRDYLNWKLKLKLKKKIYILMYFKNSRVNSTRSEIGHWISSHGRKRG